MNSHTKNNDPMMWTKSELSVLDHEEMGAGLSGLDLTRLSPSFSFLSSRSPNPHTSASLCALVYVLLQLLAISIPISMFCWLSLPLSLPVPLSLPLSLRLSRCQSPSICLQTNPRPGASQASASACRRWAGCPEDLWGPRDPGAYIYIYIYTCICIHIYIYIYIYIERERGRFCRRSRCALSAGLDGNFGSLCTLFGDRRAFSENLHASVGGCVF